MASDLTPLLDKALAERDSLQAMVGVQPPISTDNTNDAPPQRVYIYPPNSAESTQGGGAPLAQSGDITQQGLPAAPDTGNALPTPTPQDNTDALLAQREAQADAAMKAQGFDGYVPDLKHMDTPDAQYKGNGAVQDIAAGFNISLARALSLPRETVDQGMGLLGLDYMQHGSPQQHTIDALNNMGIPTYEIDNLANKIGRGALPALATYTAMQLAAPSMAAKQGIGPAAYMMREFGQWALKHPVAGLWVGQTSQAGGQIATNLVNPTSPLGKSATELSGELAGGFIPGIAKLPMKLIPGAGAATKLAGRAVGNGINAISDILPTDLGNAIKKYNPFYKQPVAVPSEAIFNPNFDANRIQNFSKDQIAAAQTYQDKAIENAINSIPTSGTPAQVQTRTHNLLQDAEKISKRIVSGFWDRVPLKKRIAVRDMRQDALRMKNELVDNDNTRPDVLLDKIITETAPQRLPTGQFKPTQMSVAKLRDYQSQIGTAITNERAQDAPREGFIRNLARLSEIIDNNIASQLPNDTTIEQARQMSKRHNDLFSRGPINDILSKRRSGDFRVPQADSIDTLLQKTDGLAALKAVQEGVSSYPRIPTNRFRPAAYYNNPVAVTVAEKAQLDQLVKSAEDSIRAAFRDAAEQGPQKAVAYSVKNEDTIKSLSKVSGELAFAAQKVSTALAEKKSIAASALSRFAETSPDKAVANIFAQRDPAGVARQLILSFRGDPDALEGLRNEILNHMIYKVGKTNPNLMQRQMQEPRIANLLEATLAPDQFARLSRMVNTAVRLGVDNEASFRQMFMSPAKTAGRLIGAMIGRRLETGTMQGPALVSQRVGKWMESMFSSTDPADILSQAVIDPNWESLLYSRVPTNSRDMERAKKIYRRIFSGINTAQQATLNKLSKDKNDE